MNAIAPSMLSTISTTTLPGAASSGGSTMNHYEEDSFLSLMSEIDPLPDLSFAVDLLGGSDVNVPSTQSPTCTDLPSIAPTEQSSAASFSLNSIQEIRKQARSATHFCTKVMRSIFKQQELKGKVVGSKKANKVDEERVNLIKLLYGAFYPRGDPQWQEWTKCVAAMNAHIRKYINSVYE